MAGRALELTRSRKRAPGTGAIGDLAGSLPQSSRRRACRPSALAREPRTPSNSRGASVLAPILASSQRVGTVWVRNWRCCLDLPLRRTVDDTVDRDIMHRYSPSNVEFEEGPVRRYVTVVGLIAGLLFAPMSPASAASDEHGDEWRHLGAGNSYQYIYWDRSERRVGLSVFADTTMSSNVCLEAMMDWSPNDGTHYDARTVRNCMPGGIISTDPLGNGYWNEPSNWDSDTHDSPITNVRAAAAYKTDDGTLDILEQAVVYGSNDIYGNRTPPTTSDKWAAVRTLYESGSIVLTWVTRDSWGHSQRADLR